MAFDPENKKDLARLHSAMVESRRKLEVFRQNREHIVRQYVGRYYGNDDVKQAVPVNLIELAVSIYTRQLAANNPQVMVDTVPKSLKSFAVNLELGLDHLIEEIVLVDTLREAVTDALFSIGIVRTGIETGRKVEIDGYLHDLGQPYATVVSLDDWVHDMRAERWDQVAFEGNRYYLPFDLLKDSGRFTESVVDDLQPDGTKYDEDGFGTDYRASDLSQGSDGHNDEFHPSISLWDMWLPYSNLFITFPVNQPDKILRVIEWDGPEAGPYHKLGFSQVPGNVMPLSPLAAGLDLHMAVNTVYRKLTNQAERQKDIVTYTGVGHKDAARVQSSSDGDMLLVQHQEAVRAMSMGGVNQNNFVFYQNAVSTFKEMMGNLDSIGGLSAQSETLGQDRLIGAAASKRVRDMQDRVNTFTKGIINSLAWYLWNDPAIELPIVKRVGDREIPTTFSAEDREGDLLDYNIDIKPFSMQDRSPSERLQGIMNYYTTVLAPGQQAFAADGGRIDYQALNRLVARLMNEDEINNLVKFSDPPETPGATGDRPIQSPVTSRTNLRINRSDTQNKEPDFGAMMSSTGNQDLPSTAAVA